jgi:hypothetical protein
VDGEAVDAAARRLEEAYALAERMGGDSWANGPRPGRVAADAVDAELRSRLLDALRHAREELDQLASRAGRRN